MASRVQKKRLKLSSQNFAYSSWGPLRTSKRVKKLVFESKSSIRGVKRDLSGWDALSSSVFFDHLSDNSLGSGKHSVSSAAFKVSRFDSLDDGSDLSRRFGFVLL